MEDPLPTTPPKSESRKARAIIIHPVLFAAAPVISLFVRNQTQVSIGAVRTPLLISIALVGLVWVGAGLLLRSTRKGAILASAAAILLLSFGHFSNSFAFYLLRWGVMSVPRAVSDWLVLAFLALVLTTLLAWLWRTRGKLGGLTDFLNIAAIVVAGFSAFNVISATLSGENAWVSSFSALREPAEPMEVPPVEVRPDVYIILADALGRADVLRDIYDHDGERFLQRLEERGFQVARNSWANYSMTALSVPSMLNYDYLEELNGRTETDWVEVHERARHSALVRRLKGHGYTIIGFDTGYEFTRLNNADCVYRRAGMTGDQFYHAFLKLTPAPLLLGDSILTSEGASKRADTRFLLRAAAMVADNPAPTFAWVHLTIPHAPFVFGPDGGNVASRYRDVEDFGADKRNADQQRRYREGYRGQAAFTERSILQLVDEILARSSEPPIILLFSDHGPRLNTIYDDEKWRSSDLREFMANLTACYLPGVDQVDAFSHTITPINVVRIMLNEYFDAQLPMVENRMYHSWLGTPPFWRFQEVTDDLRAFGAGN